MLPHPTRLLPLALLLAAATAAARPPVEQPDNLLNDRFGLQFGVMRASNTTDFRLDPTTGGLGTDLSAESDLGLPKSKVLARGEAWFRMRERHRMRISNYFVPLERRGSAVLNRTIQFRNETYFVNEQVESELNVRLLAISYTYSFIKNDRLEAGASVGFDVLSFEAKATVPARLRTERQEKSGPAPLLGLDLTGRIAGKWYAEGRAQFLRVNVSDVKGSLTTFELNGLYRMHPNVTFGLGYNSFSIDVDSRKAGDSGRLNVRSSGPQLFARVGF